MKAIEVIALDETGMPCFVVDGRNFQYAGKNSDGYHAWRDDDGNDLPWKRFLYTQAEQKKFWGLD
jgi:hypothetical protein